MGSEASSGLILFIAAITAAAVAGGAMASVIGQMTLEFQERGADISQAIGTDLDIVNDPKHMPYDDADTNLTVYVKNTGSRTLPPSDLLVLVDGLHADWNHTLLDDATRWSPGTVLEAWVDVDLAAGDHRVRASMTPNVDDHLDFRV